MPAREPERDILFHLERELRADMENYRGELVASGSSDEEEAELHALVEALVPEDHRRLGLILAETPTLGFPDEGVIEDDNVFPVIQKSIYRHLMSKADVILQQLREESRHDLPEPAPGGC